MSEQVLDLAIDHNPNRGYYVARDTDRWCGGDMYMRHDTALFSLMNPNTPTEGASSPYDGGTYFKTQEEAQALLDKYNAKFAKPDGNIELRIPAPNPTTPALTMPMSQEDWDKLTPRQQTDLNRPFDEAWANGQVVECLGDGEWFELECVLQLRLKPAPEPKKPREWWVDVNHGLMYDSVAEAVRYGHAVSDLTLVQQVIDSE